MNPETTKKDSFTRHLVIGLSALVTLFVIYYLVMSLRSPVLKIKALQSEYGYNPDERIFSDSTFLALLKEKAFLQSRVTMAETDSVYLTINLADSMVNLEISGVSVHNARIKNMKISRILESGNAFVLSSMLTKPLTVHKEYASIEKEPLMIRMAPRDTSEYVPDIMPDTADFEPVNFILETDKGIRIFFYQDEFVQRGDRSHIFFFDLRYRLKDTFASLKKTMVGKVPEYHLFIKLRLPRSDLKIIYRALPEQGQIAVYR
jgi:hypothetical protein